jgi:hypothetical protein
MKAPHLIETEDGWMLGGAAPVLLKCDVYGDYVTARAALLTARRWFRRLTGSEQVLRATCSILAEELAKEL